MKFTTGLSNYDKISSDQFSATVDFNDVRAENSKLPVNLDIYPSGVTILMLLPERVDYLIIEDER